MFKTIIAAGAISLAAVVSASAAPASPAAAAATLGADRVNSAVVDVQYHRHHSTRESRHHPRHRHHSHRYVPGRHYSRAPRGWHRYAARPWNWQTRGCVLVGPVWFCP